MDDSVAGFDVDFDDLRAVFYAVSLSFLVELLSPAKATTVLPVGHFDGFLASQVMAVDDFVVDRVEGQYFRQQIDVIGLHQIFNGCVSKVFEGGISRSEDGVVSAVVVKFIGNTRRGERGAKIAKIGVVTDDFGDRTRFLCWRLGRLGR